MWGRMTGIVWLAAGITPAIVYGGDNTSFGDYALYNVTSGTRNTAFGSGAGEFIKYGNDNVLVGFQAQLFGDTSGTVAIGSHAGFTLYGSENTIVGNNAMGGGVEGASSRWSYTGNYNVAVGSNAMAAPYTVNRASYDTAVGAASLFHNGGDRNTAVGYSALFANANGNDNVAVGFASLSRDVYGSKNTAIGSYSLGIASGSDNVGVGYQTLYTSTGAGSTAVGTQALSSSTTAAYNTAIGYYALNSATTGGDNVAIGAEALRYNVTGQQNMAIGRSALRNSVGAGFNTMLGYASCWSCKQASQNVGFGFKTLYSLQNGNYNIGIGYAAGYNVTGSYNIDIANGGMANDNGVIRIGADSTHSKAYIAGVAKSKVMGAPVYVTADGQLGTMASARRYKTAVTSLPDPADKLAMLRPVSFHLKSDPTGDVQYGLIAEEVAKVYPELVIRDEEGVVQGVRYDELAPMLLRQVQTLQRTVTAQAADLAALRARDSEVETLKARLLRLEHLADGAVTARQ